MECSLSTRYRSHEINNLIAQLQSNHQQQKNRKIQKIQEERKTHRSCIDIYKNQNLQHTRKPFNNKTREGQFFTSSPPQIPYMFIPAFKNHTFIMPDRVFAKGEQGKRFHIKMKDSSVYSFKDPENTKIREVLHKDQKEKTISGRKMEELNRILDENDGRERAKKNRWHLKNRKIFNPPNFVSESFSIVDPMMEPREPQNFTKKKTSLSKTFGPNQWRPVSRDHALGRTTHLQLSKTAGVQSFISQR